MDSYRTFYFDNRSINDDLRWNLVGPSGSFAGGTRLTTASVVNLPPGQYVLTIDGVGQAFGDYAFNLLPLDSATVVTPGTPFTGQLTEPLETVAFQFDAAAGEKYAINVVSDIAAGDTNFVLVDPSGTAIVRRSLANFETIDLIRDGVYTLSLIHI